MAPHSSTLARKISWVEEPSRLQSMGSRRVGHDWSDAAAAAAALQCWASLWPSNPTPRYIHPDENTVQKHTCTQCSQEAGHGKENTIAPHPSTLAWKIPWAEEPGGLQSMGSRRVGHDWVTSLNLHGRHYGCPLYKFLYRFLCLKFSYRFTITSEFYATFLCFYDDN